VNDRRVCIEIIDDVMVDVYRAKTPAERLAISNGMWRSARLIIDAALRTEHPDWPEEAIAREIARRMSHGAV
jgi:Rv0078B-related antitoxin